MELIASAELAGRSRNSVQGLQRIVSKRQEDGLALWAFDLLYLSGLDIRSMPYVERKMRLAGLVAHADIAALRHSEFFDDGERLLAACNRRGLEGIVSKRRDSFYSSGKVTTWIKVKCQAWRTANRERPQAVRAWITLKSAGCPSVRIALPSLPCAAATKGAHDERHRKVHTYRA